MPELPEVETIKLGLSTKIIGKKIKKINILSPKSFLGNPNLVAGKKVIEILRRAKLLQVRVEGEIYLLIHLKMSGQLIYEGIERFIGGHPTQDMLGKMPSNHTRIIFTFDDSSHLYFNDQRKFGWVKLISKKGLENERSLQTLGPEPLEKGFSWQLLKQNLLRHKSMPVKVAIMDQTVVSGVGNIYANEACFNAKLAPILKVGNLSDVQLKALHKGILKSLQDGIKHGGSSKVNFVDAEGNKGYFLDYAYCYWRDGKPCKICNSQIQKIKLGGRGTYFCPNCQKQNLAF